MKDVAVVQALHETQERLVQLLRDEHTPLALAQACSALPAGAPLFTTLLNYAQRRRARNRSSAAGRTAAARQELTNYPLALSVDETVTAFDLLVQITDRIEPSRICDFMQAALDSIVEALETAPNTQMCCLGMLSVEERRRVLAAGIGPRPSVPTLPFPTLFETQAALTPGAVALVSNGEQMSYGELNRRANRLAHRLIQEGSVPRALVGVSAERSPAMVIGLLAILKAGAAYLPLDPAYPAGRLAFMLADAKPSLVLSEAGPSLPPARHFSSYPRPRQR